MKDIKGLIFILLLSLLVFVLSISFIQWDKEGMTSNAIMAVLAGSLILVGLLLVVLRLYFREQKRGIKTEAASEVGFVVDTFHELVGALKDKERQLEMLRRLAEDRVVAVEGYNENILESVPSGVISTDDSLNITKINSAGEGILEAKRADVLGKNLVEVLRGQMSGSLMAVDNIERAEAQYITASGKRIWLGFTLSPLLSTDKKTIGKLFIFTDLTELKALEMQAELRHRLSSLGEMAAGMAHELRNPMAVIAGYTKLLEKQVDGSLRRSVDAISKEVSLMDKIINDFLSFARPGELNVSEINIYNLIKDSVEGIVSKRTDIEVSMDVDMAETIQADGILLRQAFTNLIQNSVEAMEGVAPGQKGRIAISSKREQDFLEITFSDTGHGIPSSIRDKIFLPFFTTKEKGTGLGLAMVHKIVVSHGGSIEVVDGAVPPASFRIRLPLKQGF